MWWWGPDLGSPWYHQDTFDLELQAQRQSLTSTENQLEELQSQHTHCVQDLATKDKLLCQLTQSNKEQTAQ